MSKTGLDGSSFLCGESPVGLCSNGEIKSGILNVSKQATYTAAAFTAGLWAESVAVISYSGDAVFLTNQGDLHLSQLGLSDTERRVFTEINRIVGGTGRFADADGNLFINGMVDASGLIVNF